MDRKYQEFHNTQYSAKLQTENIFHMVLRKKETKNTKQNKQKKKETKNKTKQKTHIHTNTYT